MLVRVLLYDKIYHRAIKYPKSELNSVLKGAAYNVVLFFTWICKYMCWKLKSDPLIRETLSILRWSVQGRTTVDNLSQSGRRLVWSWKDDGPYDEPCVSFTVVGQACNRSNKLLFCVYGWIHWSLTIWDICLEHVCGGEYKGEDGEESRVFNSDAMSVNLESNELERRWSWYIWCLHTWESYGIQTVTK